MTPAGDNRAALPSGWKMAPVGRHVEKMEAGASVNSDKDETPDFESFPCILKTGAMKAGAFDPRESKKVARRDLHRIRVSVRRETILVSRMNTIELVGESGFVDRDYPTIFVPDRMWMVTPKAGTDARWLSMVLSWQPVKARISAVATGTSGSMKNISKPSFKAVEIPVPPLAEQRTIASALSDADALLASLDALIAKKRAIKQSAMQQLLTGKTRLMPSVDGVTYVWPVVPLGSISSMKGRIGWQGLKQEEFTQNADDPFLITGMNFKDGVIRWEEVYHFPESRYAEAPEIQLRTGDVLMTKDGTIGKVLFVGEIPPPGRASLNSHLLVFRPVKEAYEPRYLYYLLQSKSFIDFAESTKAGSTFTGISQAAMGQFPVPLPSLPEQRAIAAVLTEIDQEIELLQARREKAKMVKHGMMQALLTGRVRLPVLQEGTA